MTIQFRFLARLAFAACGLIGINACDDDSGESGPSVPSRPAAGCKEKHFEACNIYDRECQENVYLATACLWGAGQDQTPGVEFISSDQYRERIRAGRRAPDPDQTFAQVQGRALALLHLGNKDDFLPADMENLLVSTVPAYYDGRAVVFVEPEGPVLERSQGETTILLSHEFTHALQGTTIDWAAAGPAPDSYDSTLAYLSVLEGSAEVIAALFDASMWGLDSKKVDLNGHLTGWLAAVEANLQGSSALLGSNRYFPYTYGATYAYAAYSDGGTKAMRALFKPVLAATLPVLWTLEGVPPTVEALPAEAPVPPEGYELTHSDRLGAWILQKFVQRIEGSASHSAALDTAWRDDRFFAYHRELGNVVAVWKLRLSNETTARELLRIVELAGLSGELQIARQTGSDVTLVLSEGSTDVALWRAAVDLGPEVTADGGLAQASGNDAGVVDGGARVDEDATFEDAAAEAGLGVAPKANAAVRPKAADAQRLLVPETVLGFWPSH